MREPIRIRCEGSGGTGHSFIGEASVMCRMCGRYPGLAPLTDRLVEHDREDIIAMIDRGDFG